MGKMSQKKVITLGLVLWAFLCAVTVPTMAAEGEISIDATNFPDMMFREYVSTHFDVDKNGVLSAAEIEKVTVIGGNYVYVTDNNSILNHHLPYGNTMLDGVQSLEGLEYFYNLKQLNCYNSDRTYSGPYNYITTLDISKNTNLEVLACSGNALKQLDLSQNTKLTHLYCDNNFLSSLNVSGLTHLTNLSCSRNSLTSLDVGTNALLTVLDCHGNELTALNLRMNPALTDVNCSYNQIVSLSLTGNPALETLNCSWNMLHTLDSSQNIALTALNCDNNQIASLNLTSNPELRTLNCAGNRLTQLDLTANSALTQVNCSGNSLHTLNTGSSVALTSLNCSFNQLTQLNILSHTMLQSLSCVGNYLTSVDLSANFKLSTITFTGYCNDWNTGYSRYGSQSYPILLTDGTFDLHQLPAGFDFTKAKNWTNCTVDPDTQILKVNGGVSSVTYDYTYTYGKNEGTTTFTLTFTSPGYLISTESSANYDLVPLAGTSPYAPLNSSYQFSIRAKDGYILSDEVALTAQISYAGGYYSATALSPSPDGIYTISGVRSDYLIRVTGVVPYDVADWVELMPTNFPDEQFLSRLKLLDTNNDGKISRNQTQLNLANAGIASLEGLNEFPNLLQLYCHHNALTTLDLSGNPKVQVLDCGVNQLAVLEVRCLPDLTTLDCNNNRLKGTDALDLSQNTKLISLACNGNQLGGLDLRANSDLIALNCIGIGLTSLDLSGNPNLQTLACESNQLTELDLRNNSSLVEVACSYNTLYVLRLGSHPNLQRLACAYNQLTALDTSGCPKLYAYSINVSGNNFRIYPINGVLTADNFPDGFDIRRVVSSSGGVFDANAGTLTVNGGVTSVTYQYQAANQVYLSFTLSLSEVNGFYVSAQPGATYSIIPVERKAYVPLGGSYSFVLIANDGYRTSDQLQVYAMRGQYGELLKLTPTNNIYTINNIYSDYTVYAFGIEVCADIDDWLKIDEAHFEDYAFRVYLMNTFDRDGDGYLSPNTVAAIRSIEVPEMGISSLQGIEHFLNLDQLYCTWNTISYLDVTHNPLLTVLDCSSNDLTSLDLTRNPNLLRLDCSTNYISSLNLNSNSELEYINCSYNQLSTLLLNDHAKLTELYCGENDIQALDLQHVPALVYLVCPLNTMSSLDLSQNTALTRLDCRKNNLNVLDLNVCNKLNTLDCRENQLQILDLSPCTALHTLNCADNVLISLNVNSSRALRELSCQNNLLPALDVTNCREMTFMNCSHNHLSSLILPNNGTLKSLECSNNRLSVLDVRLCKDLLQLDCSDNQLTTLNLNENVKLASLSCSNNQLAALALENNIKLTSVEASGNGTAVTATAGSTFDLATLPGVDVSRVTDLQNATIVEGSTIAIDENVTEVVYTYVCSSQQKVSFKLALANHYRGDIDHNGVIDSADLEKLFAHLRGVELLKGDAFMHADMDGNNILNSRDANTLLHMIAIKSKP